MHPLEQIEKMLAVLEPPAPRSSEKDDRIARAIFDRGGASAKAAALHLGLEQRGSEVFQAKIHETAKKVQQGDLSDIERMLVEQFVLLNSMMSHYALAASNLPGGNAKLAPQLVDMTVKCSRASRQVATTIQQLKSPRKAVFIKQQLNQLNVDQQKELEQSNALSVDARAEGVAEAGCAEVEAVAAQHRPQNGRR